MVGTNTALNDNPQLNVREIKGENPLRIVLDLNLRLPKTLNVFDGSSPTLVLNYQVSDQKEGVEYVKLDPNKKLTDQILEELYQRNIISMIIEGGAQLLNTFIDDNLWDETRVFVGDKYFEKGLKAPKINKEPINSLQFDTDILTTYMND